MKQKNENPTIYELMCAKYSDPDERNDRHIEIRFIELKKQLLASPGRDIEVNDLALAMKCVEAGLYVAELFDDYSTIIRKHTYWLVSIP